MGLAILEGFSWNARRGRWEDGSIYDPETGDTYDSRLYFEGATRDRFTARGYIGLPMLGRSVVFRRTADDQKVDNGLCAFGD